jgi:hypothetical protein
MADAFLNAGATSLAAANWSDSTGYTSGTPTLFVQSGTQTITGGLAPGSGTYVAVNNFDILTGFSGNIGGSAGSFAIETANYNPSTQVGRIRYNASGGTFYYTPQGANVAADVCDLFQVNGSGSAFLTGTGTVKRVDMQSGRLYVSPTIGSVATYRWVLSGGTTTIDGILGSTKIHSITVAGGQHLIKKGIQGSTLATTGFVEGLNVCNGSVVIDCYSETISDLRIYGGYVTVVNCGAIAAVGGYNGTLDFSKLQRPVTVTLMEDAPGLTVIPSKLLTITTYSGATNGRQPIGTGANGLT